MTPLSDLFFETVKEFHMIDPGDNVLVGFSGGADSVCLLSLLYEHRSELGISLRAAHINHGLRGKEADRDEVFASAFCRERGIPFLVLHADVGTIAENNGMSVEECAREVRYGFFAECGADKIATAHTGSDAIETLLLNLSRGTSLHGLASIPPKRDNIIRPLIRFTREQTEFYCKENGLSFVTDSSNLSNDFTRNRIRHTVVPALKEVGGAFETSALRCIENLRTEDAYMQNPTERAYTDAVCWSRLDAAKYTSLPEAIRLRLMALFLKRCADADVQYRHIRLLDRNITVKGFALTVPGGADVRSDGDCLFINKCKTTVSPTSISISKNDLRKIVFGGFQISFSRKSYEPFRDLSFNYVDFSKIDDIIIIRSRMPGDRISLPGRKCSKTLKKLFCEMKIPEEQRPFLPVIADPRVVIWVYGAGADAARLPDEKTEQIMFIIPEVDKE